MSCGGHLEFDLCRVIWRCIGRDGVRCRQVRHQLAEVVLRAKVRDVYCTIKNVVRRTLRTMASSQIGVCSMLNSKAFENTSSTSLAKSREVVYSLRFKCFYMQGLDR